MPENEYANEPNQSRSEDIIQSIIDNTEYDEPARSRIEYLLKQLKGLIATLRKAVILRGETTTPITDNATTNPIMIDGQSHTAIINDAVIYQSGEFIFDGTKWHALGDLSNLTAANIGAMSNYVKAVTAADIDPTDTLNQAIGKLEKRISDNENNISSEQAKTTGMGTGGSNYLQVNGIKMYFDTTAPTGASVGDLWVGD